MFKIGLCSVTFRKLSVEEIIKLSSQAGLDGIEWGGDLHVKPGDLNRAAAVAEQSKNVNLAVTSYGSYYLVGDDTANKVSFEDILQTAKHLTAPAIRVWAGTLGSNKADDSYRDSVIQDAKRIGDLAKKENISINFEYHGGTLTDTKESATHLMLEINHPNVNIYWQPAVGESVENRLSSIQQIKPWLSHVHVFHWHMKDRLPFSQGKDEWIQYLKQLQSPNKTRYLLMEFVKNNHVEQFLKDVEALQDIMKTLNNPRLSN